MSYLRLSMITLSKTHCLLLAQTLQKNFIENGTLRYTLLEVYCLNLCLPLVYIIVDTAIVGIFWHIDLRPLETCQVLK